MATVKRKATKAEKADPIFAAIENHKKLVRIFLDVSRAEDEGRARDVDVDRAMADSQRAARKMARTKPTTVGGASAMLSYIATNPITGLFELGETGWHEVGFRTVTASLARIARQSQRAA
jgi:hypothetical protein